MVTFAIHQSSLSGGQYKIHIRNVRNYNYMDHDITASVVVNITYHHICMAVMENHVL